MSPNVSVILPFFNAEKTLNNAIQSILNQTFQSFELILVDNNSTDNSRKVAESLMETDSRVSLIYEPKQGVAFAMNKGLTISTGKYIARMDADDISMPERIKKQVDYLEQNPDTDLVGSEVKYMPHHKNTKGFRHFINWVNSFHTTEEIRINRFIEIPIVNPTIMFRRNLFEKYGGCKHGDFPEDYEMILRYLVNRVKIIKLPEILFEWHDYKTRLTRTDPRYSTDAFFQTKAKFFFRWSEKYNPFHPIIWIWGAGRTTRKRALFLENEGIKINGFIDLEENKLLRIQCISYNNIPKPGKIFIVSMVGNYGARDKIKKYLVEKKYNEGNDFILMA